MQEVLQYNKKVDKGFGLAIHRMSGPTVNNA